MPKAPQTLPIILSPAEVRQFLSCVPRRKGRTVLTVCYAAGLRISEAISLKPTDIDSQRMTIRVAQGKGQKDRYVMLSAQLLTILRDWYRAARPTAWLFPGLIPGSHVTREGINDACQLGVKRSGLSKPVTPHASAIEKLRWYALRWRIETFHKILKSGCRAEQSKLRTAERLVNLLAMFCILSWRIFWLTMINRVAENVEPEIAFTPLEIDLLSRLTQRRSKVRASTLHDCLTQLAKLGGYLARAGYGPPGNMVIWRGMTRLTDIELGFQLGSQHVGN